MTSEKSAAESSMQVMSANTVIKGYTTQESVYFHLPTNPPKAEPDKKQKEAPEKKQSIIKSTLQPDQDQAPTLTERSSAESSMQVMSANTVIKGYTTQESVYFHLPTNPPKAEPEKKQKEVHEIKQSVMKSVIQPSHAKEATDNETSSSVSGVSQIHLSNAGSASQHKSTALERGGPSTVHGANKVDSSHTLSQTSTMNNTYFALPSQPNIGAPPTMDTTPAHGVSSSSKIQGLESLDDNTRSKVATTKNAPLTTKSAVIVMPSLKTNHCESVNGANAKTAIPVSTVPTPVPSATIIGGTQYSAFPVTNSTPPPSGFQANKMSSSVQPETEGSRSQMNNAPSAVQPAPVPHVTKYLVSIKSKPAHPTTPGAPPKTQALSVAAGSHYVGDGHKSSVPNQSEYVAQEVRNASGVSAYITNGAVPQQAPSRAAQSQAALPKPTTKPAGGSNYQPLSMHGKPGSETAKKQQPAATGTTHSVIKPATGAPNYPKPTGGNGGSNYLPLSVKSAAEGAKPSAAGANADNYHPLKPTGGNGGSNYQPLSVKHAAEGAKPSAAGANADNYHPLKPTGGNGGSNYQPLSVKHAAEGAKPSAAGANADNYFSLPTGGNGGSTYQPLSATGKLSADSTATAKPDYENLTSYETLLKSKDEKK